MNITHKIIKDHLIEGTMVPGSEIAIRIDQTLTQDATGTMAYLEFEAMGIPRVRTKLSVSYVDHNTLQTGHENADDHLFLQGFASKYSIYFSRPGNGICHQVHIERFAVPGETLIGSDSHTPTSGGIGMLAIGTGGLDVAVAMAGGPFYLLMPQVVLINIDGRLREWVTAKDIILWLLKRLTVKGGVGKILEYGGKGVKTLSVPERATIANMGAELGATTSIFPSDEETLRYLKSQGREKAWSSFHADDYTEYDDVLSISLDEIEPMIARPHSPDNVVTVKEAEGIRVNQVVIGSCTNSSYEDLMKVASILRGKKVHRDVSLAIVPGSRQVLQMIAKNGALADMVSAGARVLESACGPCIGMGQLPPSGGVSLRTFNRNFEGRSGTADASVYLSSPEVAAASAITGVITDPRNLGKAPRIRTPKRFFIDDSMILPPSEKRGEELIIRGPNIKALPKRERLAESIYGSVLIKLGDNITTDHILPAGAKILPLRSNIPAIAEYVFNVIDEAFVKRAKEKGGGFIVGGFNYGQGSSREHAALAPMYLGIKAVLARSFARIHRDNLINFGILPLLFLKEADYEWIRQDDELAIPNLMSELRGTGHLTIDNLTRGGYFKVGHNLSKRQIDIIIEGGLLNYTLKHINSIGGSKD